MWARSRLHSSHREVRGPVIARPHRGRGDLVATQLLLAYGPRNDLCWRRFDERFPPGAPSHDGQDEEDGVLRHGRIGMLQEKEGYRNAVDRYPDWPALEVLAGHHP